MKIFLVLAVFILVSCASYSPIPEGYDGPTARISDSYTNDTGASAHYFMLYKIDSHVIRNSWGATRSRYQGMGVQFDPVIVERSVVASEAKYTLQGIKFFPTDVQSLFGNEMKVTGDIVFTPEANKNYYVRGELSKDGSKVWLEDSEGNIVSRVIR